MEDYEEAKCMIYNPMPSRPKDEEKLFLDEQQTMIYHPSEQKSHP